MHAYIYSQIHRPQMQLRAIGPKEAIYNFPMYKKPIASTSHVKAQQFPFAFHKSLNFMVFILKELPVSNVFAGSVQDSSCK